MTGMSRMKWNIFGAFAALALAATPGFANPILVNNFSFESLPPANLQQSCAGIPGCVFYPGAAIPGWVNGAGTGLILPGPVTGNPVFSSMLDGPSSATSNNGSIISQTVGETVRAGVTYTLMVDIGWRLDLPFGGIADLRIGSGSTSTAVFATGLTPVRGTFGTFKATYTGLVADIGKTITIELGSSGLQGNFDNVQLSETPEPASFLLIGSALLALTALGRRCQKS
jgi:hypothetical protein